VKIIEDFTTKISVKFSVISGNFSGKNFQ